MKASVKVREVGKKPLMRAKVPITIFGLRFFSAISVGNAEELALHLGSYLAVGPSSSSSSSSSSSACCCCKFSFRPNDEQRAFTVMFKTRGGFGSSSSMPWRDATLSMAAEFNLSNSGNPAFVLRLKPRFGDFSFRKESCSSPNSTGLSSSFAAVAATPAVSSVADPAPAFGRNGVAGMFASTTGDRLSPLGLGLSSGLHANERSSQSLPKRTGGTDATIPVVEQTVHKRLEDGDGASQASDDSMVIVSGAHLESHADLALAIRPREEKKANNGGWRRTSWLEENAKSWNLGVHSVIPLGRHVLGRVRWGLRFPATNILHNQESGFSFCARTLPVLVMDKIGIESVDPLRSLLAAKPSWSALEEASFSKYTLMMEEEGSREESCQQVEGIAAMCCSLQHQLHILHSQNQMLKKTMDDMRVDIVAQGTKHASMMKKKKKPAELLMMQEEENILRSQLFHEVNVKFNGNNLTRNESKETSYWGKNSEGKKESQDIARQVELKPSSVQSHERFANSTSAEWTIKPEVHLDHAVTKELKKAIRNATNSAGA